MTNMLSLPTELFELCCDYSLNSMKLLSATCRHIRSVLYATIVKRSYINIDNFFSEKALIKNIIIKYDDKKYDMQKYGITTCHESIDCIFENIDSIYVVCTYIPSTCKYDQFINLKKISINCKIRFSFKFDLSANIKLEEINLITNYQDIDLNTHNNINLKILRITGGFNGDVNLIDNVQLEVLELGDGFNQLLDLSKNTKLRVLKLGDEFNHLLDLSKNTMLRTVYLGNKFNHLLDLSKNTMLDNIRLGIFNKSLNLSHNKCLKCVDVSLSTFAEKIDLINCVNLKELFIDSDFFMNTIANFKSLTKLHISNIKHPLDLSKNSCLKELQMSGTCDYPLDLSNCTELEILNLFDDFNHPLDLSKNTKLKVLKMACKFDHPINLSKHIDLETLYLGLQFNKPIDLTNNKKIKTLSFGDKFNSYIGFHEHNIIEYLHLGKSFEQDILFFYKNIKILSISNLMYEKLMDYGIHINPECDIQIMGSNYCEVYNNEITSLDDYLNRWYD